jgi:DNA-binding GntR family transcriptional regulator
LEPLAFSLAAQAANARDIETLQAIIEKTKLEAKAEDLEGFFESHLKFRQKIWQTSGNRFVQQSLERVVIPLYALYLIRRSYNRDGILKRFRNALNIRIGLLTHCVETSLRKLVRLRAMFLVRMKEYLGSRLVPEVK